MSDLDCIRQTSFLPSAGEEPPFDGEVVEFVVLASQAQFQKLERRATRIRVSID